MLRLVEPLAEVIKIAVGDAGRERAHSLLDGVATDRPVDALGAPGSCAGTWALNFGDGDHEAEA